MEFSGSVSVFLPSKAHADKLSDILSQPDYGPEHMHLTLTYIGGEFVRGRDLDATMTEMRKMARKIAPFEAKVSGVGYLGKDEAVVAFVESDIVMAAQKRLAPLAPPSIFPAYIPHVTLGYKGSVDSVSAQIPATINFSRMAVFTAGQDPEIFTLTGK
jgi:2'-5' RNA ligase